MLSSLKVELGGGGKDRHWGKKMDVGRIFDRQWLPPWKLQNFCHSCPRLPPVAVTVVLYLKWHEFFYFFDGKWRNVREIDFYSLLSLCNISILLDLILCFPICHISICSLCTLNSLFSVLHWCVNTNHYRNKFWFHQSSHVSEECIQLQLCEMIRTNSISF